MCEANLKTEFKNGHISECERRSVVDKLRFYKSTGAFNDKKLVPAKKNFN